MFLDDKTFSTIVESTPLVAIDLVVLNEFNELLLGKRLNRPAKNFWFVPGGRILKNESLNMAFKRLTKIELGSEIEITQAYLLGVYDHFYQDSMLSENISTHYVNAAHFLTINSNQLRSLPYGLQHEQYQWHDIDGIEDNPEVHSFTKAYIPSLLKCMNKA